MAKKKKLSTPAWILEGYDSKEEYEKATGNKSESSAKEKKKTKKKTKKKKASKGKSKTFHVKECPKCGSDDVGVIIGKEEGNPNEWECRKCGWQGQDDEVVEKELNEDEFLEYMEGKE